MNDALLFKDTCAAISTAIGKAGISVVRISGKFAFEIAEKVFFPKSKKPLSSYDRYAVYGDIVYRGDIIDSGLCTCFHAPHSYTGEDMCEISCHGSILATNLLLSALLENGATLARAGEFTKRAFINGKLDLTQAEAVGELLEAESYSTLIHSAAKLGGNFSRKIADISQRIYDILSSVYAFIDYPDEDLADMDKETVLSSLLEIEEELCTLKNSYDAGKALFSGIEAAIVGLANTGKSSLLNMLLGIDRAIVTDIAGTTRDVVSEYVTVANVRLHLSDTAGLRETQDVIEKIGIEKSRNALAQSSLVFALFDTTYPLCEEERELCEELKLQNGKNIIAILNKSDMDSFGASKREYLEKCGFTNIISISAKNNIGIEEIENALKKLYPLGDEQIREGLIITGARVYEAVLGAYECVLRAKNALSAFSTDVAGFDLESAQKFLCEADGRGVSEKIVDNIFSKFCVGK